MGLIAVEVWERDDEGVPRLGMEFRLDSANQGRALLSIGRGNEQAERWMREGITLPFTALQTAAKIGAEEGVSIPEPLPGDKVTFTPADGIRFLIAILSELERDNGYIWALRTKE
jgi:hypothetical protein